MDEQTINPKNLYQIIIEEHKELTRKSVEKGSETIVDGMRSFVQRSKDNYQVLWKAKLHQEAEQIRTLAYHWAGRYERVTGKKEAPGITFLN